MVPTPRVAARRRTLRAVDRCVELWLHSGRTLPEEAALPSEHRDGATGRDLQGMRNTYACRVAGSYQIAAVWHAEGEEALPEEVARGFCIYADTGAGPAGQDARVGPGAEDNGRGRA